MSTIKSMSDEQLALAYIDGNNKAFDELLSRNQDKVFTYIMCIVKNEDLANDLFQETFLKVITKFCRFWLSHCTYFSDSETSRSQPVVCWLSFTTRS